MPVEMSLPARERGLKHHRYKYPLFPSPDEIVLDRRSILKGHFKELIKLPSHCIFDILS